MITKQQLGHLQSKHEDDLYHWDHVQRYGLFSYPGCLAECDDSFPQQEKRHVWKQETNKNFMTSNLKNGKTKDAFFSSFNHTHDPYNDQKQNIEQARATGMMKFHGKPFMYAGSSKPLNVKYDYQMPGNNKPPRSNAGRNFLTTPNKRGTTAKGATFGKFPEYIPDPYERKEDLHRASRQNERGSRIGGGPYMTTSKGNGQFTGIHDLYNEDGIAKNRPRTASANYMQHQKPWLATSPVTPCMATKSGIGRYPAYKSETGDKYPYNTLYGTNDEPWRYTHKERTVPCPPTFKQNHQQMATVDLDLGENTDFGAPLNAKSQNELKNFGSPTHSTRPDGTERQWTQRTFGKLEPGSMRGSIFTLAGTAIGAGCLATPKVLEFLGLFLGCFMLVFCAFITRQSMRTMIKASEQSQIYLYPDMVKSILGLRWGYLLESIIILYVFVVLIGYQVIIGSLVPRIFQSIDIPGADTLADRDFTMVIAAFLVMPLAFFRDLSQLRFAGLVSIFALIYVALVVLVEFGFYAQVNDFNELKYAYVDLNIFDAYSISVFAYVCHTNLVKVYGELSKRHPQHMFKVIDRSLYLEMLFFFIMSVFGYMSFLDDTPAIAPLRKPPSNIHNDWAMVIGQVLILFTLMIALPINIPPCRESILKICFKQEDPKLAPTWMHATVTLVLLLTSLVIALFYPDILSIFSFLGGFCGVTMVLIFPGALFVKISEHPISHWTNVTAIVLVVFLSCIGFTSVILTVIRLAGGN